MEKVQVRQYIYPGIKVHLELHTQIYAENLWFLPKNYHVIYYKYPLSFQLGIWMLLIFPNAIDDSLNFPIQVNFGNIKFFHIISHCKRDTIY